MTEGTPKIHKYEIGDVLFCTFFKVTVVLQERVKPINKSFPVTWKCHLLGEELKTYLVLEKDLISVI